MNENFRILKPYLRGFPLIVAAMIIAVLISKKYLGYVTPMYESTVKMKLADVSEGVPSSNLFKDLDVFATANKIAAEIELIKSSLMINKVLDSLDFDLEVYRIGKVRKVELYHESPFLISGNFTNEKLLDNRFSLQVVSTEAYRVTLPNSTIPISGNFGHALEIPGGQLTISLNNKVIASKKDFLLVDNYEFEFLSREKLVSKILKTLDVVSIDKDVAVIRISIKSPIPEKAALFVNKMAECYINDYIETKYKAAHTTVRFLEDRIKDISAKLNVSENIIQRYRDNRNITNIPQETETDLRKISQLKIQQANLKMNLDAIVDLDLYIKEGKDRFLELAPNFEAFTDLLSTEIVKKIKQLQADKKDLLLTYTPEDERVKVIDAKLVDLISYLVESIANTRRNLQVKYDRLSMEIADAEKVFIGVPEKQKMLTILNREFEIYQRSYNFLNEKKIEAEIAQSAKIAFHRVISPADPSKTPVSPNRPIIIIVAALMGMFGSIAFIFVVHMAKAKVNDVYTIERNSSIPVALSTPYFPRNHDITSHFLKEAVQLELKGCLQPGYVVVITSGSPKEGKGYHSYNLARAFAEQGRKVLLANVGSTSPVEHTANMTHGIEYLNLSDPSFKTFSKTSFERYLTDIKKSFDLVIVNNEPITSDTIGLVLMSIADTNLFVLDSRKTSEKQIAETALMQKEFGLPNLWFVLNKAGYNPNIVVEIVEWIMLVKNKLTKPKTA